MSRTYEAMLVCLLNAVGEAGVPARIPLPDSVRAALDDLRSGQKPPTDPLACVAWIADRIARDVDSDDETEAAPDRALDSIFNGLNQSRSKGAFRVDWEDAAIQYPAEGVQNNADAYRQVFSRWAAAAQGDLFREERTGALLDALERCFAYVPRAEGKKARCDVSAFHHGKAAAAIACCIERWLEANGETDHRRALCEDEKAFCAKNAFLLYSLDLSGIQSFIYTISNKGALKGLRVRSFYLSLMMEHIADQILEACGLYRVNLIYCGGGRVQLLLPNDGECLQRAEEIVAQANAFFQARFGAALFLASGWVEASADALASRPGAAQHFSGLFREASAMISQRKLQRYSPRELLELNQGPEGHSADRECVICGQSGHLVPHGDGEMVCETCAGLERFAGTLAEGDIVLAVTTGERANAIPLPGGMWLYREQGQDAAHEDGGVVRRYAVNRAPLDRDRAARLYIGSYRAAHVDGAALTFEELAAASSGVKRLGVLRADVDNLGALFAAGFYAPDDPQPHRYETLPRYMALSAALTAFFQREINRVVECGEASWLPGSAAAAGRNASIVYSGGDDVFLIGAWNEVLDAGLDLQKAFARYTGGSVTLSAGFGLFPEHEPVGIMAEATADLEEAAKLIGDGAKNALCLFSDDGDGPSFAFRWEDFHGRIVEKLLPMLDEVFGRTDADEVDAGNAFLYQVLGLLRTIRSEPIAIARLAYLLARRAPDPHRVSRERVEVYDRFSKNTYAWALDPEQNRALQVAILLHVYAHRGERETDV